MRVLVAPDKFKGSLTAREAAAALGRGWKRGCPGARLDLAALADGGDGFLEVLVAARGGRVEAVRGIEDAVFRRRTVPLGWIDRERTAVIEMARVCGLAELDKPLRNPEATTTLGLGRLLRHALRRGAGQVWIGLGGSATHDGGMGLAQGMGFRFFDRRGRKLEPVGAHLGRVARIDPAGWCPARSVVAAVDVDNPLFGPQGAAAVFAPQKGASPAMVRRLDAGSSHFAALAGARAAREPGAGAAGGAAYGLMVFCGAALQPGFDLVAEALDLEARVRRADLVLTGEGCLDGQTARGKGPERLRRMARAAGKPVLAFAGSVLGPHRFDAAVPLMRSGLDLEAAQAHASALLETAAADAGAVWRAKR
jgi:glycerate kinase